MTPAAQCRPDSQPLADVRTESLTLAHRFCAHHLSATVRRIATWKRLAGATVPDLIADLAQEIVVDCLEQPGLIVQLGERARHRRWMRLAERWIYHERVAPMRRTGGTPQAEEHLVAPPRTDATLLLPIPSAAQVRLANGRTNVKATAARIGITHRELRRRFDLWADQLDHGEPYLLFWRTRAAEAMTGLAADLLQQRGQVHLLAEPKRRPNPQGRMQRLRRIARRFAVRSSTRAIRHALRRWLRRGRAEVPTPRLLLENAVALVPHATGSWLWLFEACLAEGDLRAAAKAMRAACHLAKPSRRARTLARARLLEARGRLPAAIALLQRASRRWPDDGALAAVSRRVSAAP